MQRVLIIGAGAAGLMAAISAAENGASVTVLEHKSEPGIKLKLTGNGKCNYTNTKVSALGYHSSSGSCKVFIEQVLKAFGYEDCISFFRRIGVNPEIIHYSFDDSGYIYPEGMKAPDLRDCLYQEALRLGVSFSFNTGDEAVIAAIENAAASNEYYDSVIIAAGANAYPETGSDSSVYPALKRLGIRMNRFLPALCALYSKDEMLKSLKGRRVRAEVVLSIGNKYSSSACSNAVSTDAGCNSINTDGDCCIEADGIREYSCYGEIQFNEHNISGIPVMQLSGYAAIALNEGRTVSLSILGHSYSIHRTAGFNKAQVCTGGVDTAFIDPATMQYTESAAVSAHGRIYFCGEITDINGDCGGYNLHYAWASGYIAGRAAAGKSETLTYDKN